MEHIKRIWVIHNNLVEGKKLAGRLKEHGYLPTLSLSERELFSNPPKTRPDLVLLHVDSYPTGIANLMEKLEDAFGQGEVPLIILSSLDNPKVAVKILDEGGWDYIRSPYNFDELDARMKKAIKQCEAFKTLKERNRQLEQMAVTDSLTGLYNHRFLIKQLNRYFDLLKRFQRPFSFIMLDIDHFKKINDQYGHLTGDQVLVHFSNTIKSGRRNMDIIGRYGGDEFCLILPEIRYDKAGKVALRLLKDIQGLIFSPQNNSAISFGISSSLGIVSCPDAKIDRPEKIINFADQALYKAKELGGGTIVQVKEGLLTEIRSSL